MAMTEELAPYRGPDGSVTTLRDSLFSTVPGRRGVAEAFRLGWGHGLFCLGCCWALMLLMFAAGVADLWWMAALTALTVYEKVGAHGERVVSMAGSCSWGSRPSSCSIPCGSPHLSRPPQRPPWTREEASMAGYVHPKRWLK